MRSDGVADQHLARAGKAADTGSDVHGKATDDVIREQLTFAGVQAGANVQAELADTVTNGDCAADRAAWAIERGKYPITERLDEPAPVELDLTRERIVAFKQRAPSGITELGGTGGRPDDVGKEHGRQHAVAANRSSYACQELLDLGRGLAACRELDVSRARDVGRGVARVTFVNERVAGSVQHQRRTLHAGQRVTHIQLADHGKRCGGGIRSHRQTPVAREQTLALLILTGESAPRLLR